MTYGVYAQCDKLHSTFPTKKSTQYSGLKKKLNASSKRAKTNLADGCGSRADRPLFHRSPSELYPRSDYFQRSPEQSRVKYTAAKTTVVYLYNEGIQYKYTAGGKNLTQTCVNLTYPMTVTLKVLDVVVSVEYSTAAASLLPSHTHKHHTTTKLRNIPELQS